MKYPNSPDRCHRSGGTGRVKPYFCGQGVQIMKNLVFYRILTYLLLAIAGVIAFFVLGGLIAALANPVMLIFVFLMICVVIYSYSSFRFLSRGIDAHMYCKPSLRDLIRVNGIGTLVLGGMGFINALVLKMNPEMMNTAVEQALSMQKEEVEGLEEMMHSTMKVMLNFLLVYGLMLLIHVSITFRLLKQHADAFDIPAGQE